MVHEGRLPLAESPTSATVVARTCAEAEAWGMAIMVLSMRQGQAYAETHSPNVLFLLRETTGATVERSTGRFLGQAMPIETHTGRHSAS